MGAIVALVLSLTPVGQEERAVDYLVKFWQNLNDDAILESWTWGLVQGLFFRSGLFSGAPLAHTLAKMVADLNTTFHRKLAIDVAEINTGKTKAPMTLT